MFAHRNTLAERLRSLHIPGNPIILTNCYDGATAKLARRAAATASYAIAASRGVSDAELTLADNLDAIRLIARVTNAAGIPLTADMQDGYDDVAHTISEVIKAGAVGANIEDSVEAGSIRHGIKSAAYLRPSNAAVSRIAQAVKTAESLGVPDFCLNARTDALMYANMEEAIRRGRAFLEAGATSVYVLGSGPLSKDEIVELVQAFDGRVNIKLYMPGRAKDIVDLGVSRVSCGPDLYRRAMAAYAAGIDEIMQ